MLQGPPEDARNKYFQEIGITKESLARDVASLRSWLEKQPHLPNNVGDDLLEKFLIHSKNSLERAKRKLDGYYSARVTYPEFLGHRDPNDAELKAFSKVMMFCVCPKTTFEGYRVTIVKMFDFDLKKFDFIKVMKMGLMTLDCHLPEDNCIKHIAIFDFNGTSLGHAATFTPPSLKKAITLFLDVFPTRYAGFHLVNSPPFFESLVNICKNFLPSKTAKRVFVHGQDMTTLHDHVDIKVLPSEYGGLYPATIQDLRDNTYKSLEERRAWFLEQNEIMTDENKRVAKTLNGLDATMEGSFRKINID